MSSKIDRHQIRAVQASAEEAFIDRVIDHLLKQHAPAVSAMPPDMLRERVLVALARGRSYGFTWHSSLVGFVTLMFEVSPNFDQHPAFQQVLDIEDPDEDFRVLALYAGVTDKEWIEAQLLYDQSAWYRPTASSSRARGAPPGAMH